MNIDGGDRRGGAIARRRRYAEEIIPRVQIRETVEAGREGVDPAATVGSRSAGDDRCRVGADTIIAVNGRGLVGRSIDKGDGGAIYRQAGHGIKDNAEGVDQGGSCGAVGAIDGVGIMALNLRVLRHIQPAVLRDVVAAGHRLDIAAEDAGIGTGLGYDK